MVSDAFWDLQCPDNFYVCDEWYFFLPFIDNFVIVYLNDIHLFSITWDEDVQHVRHDKGEVV